jgi:hypothetical protein
MQRRSFTEEDGTLVHVLDYDDGESSFDSVAIRYPIDTKDTVHVVGYEGDDAVYKESFRERDVSFEPVSAMGKGAMSSAIGLSVADGDTDTPPETPTGYGDFDEVPRSVMLALLGVGYTVVPDGRGWLDVE